MTLGINPQLSGMAVDLWNLCQPNSKMSPFFLS